MVNKTVYEEACDDIRTNLWVLGPEAKNRIIMWFNRITNEAYDRGAKDEAKRIGSLGAAFVRPVRMND
jgi:hypothetical protein